MGVFVLANNPEDGGLAQSFSCEYTIDVRNDVGEGHSGAGGELGIPARQYIWYGGQWPDDHEDYPGEDWCFAYGERAWREGASFTETRDAAIGDAETDPVGRRDCYSGELAGED